jgi:hypothetical protein
MNTAKQFYIEWFLPGMHALDDWSLILSNDKKDLQFRCRQNHELWKDFEMHKGYFNWCSVAMTREECEIVCRWLVPRRQVGPLHHHIDRAVDDFLTNGLHKMIILLKAKEWDNIDIANTLCTSTDNIKKVLARKAEEAGYDSTIAFINALKMRLYLL